MADILVKWLVQLDYDHTEYDASKNIKPDTDGTIRVLSEKTPQKSLDSEHEYIVARFVNHLHRASSPSIDYLTKIAAAGLLTDVIADLQKPRSSVKKSNLKIYLDSPLAMELLGVSGAQAKSILKSIFDRAKEIGANFYVIDSTIDEIENSLSALLKRDVPLRTGPTADALRKGETSEEYVKEVRRNPARALKSVGVKTEKFTDRIAKQPSEYFDPNDYDNFYSKVSWHWDPKPREHDALAMALIMRKRRDHHSDDLFELNSVFVTRNELLSRTAKRFASDIGTTRKSDISPIIHQRYFATSLWLRVGSGINSIEIPRSLMLASCESVLRSNPRIIERARKRAKEVSEDKMDQLDLLLSTDRNVLLLQDNSIEEARSNAETDIDVILDKMKATFVEAERIKHDEEISKLRDVSRKKGRRRSVAIAVAKREIEEKDAEVDRLLTEIKIREKEDYSAMMPVLQIGNTSFLIWKIIINTGLFITSALIGLIAYYSDIFPQFIRPALLITSTFIAIFLTYLSISGKYIKADKLCEDLARTKIEKVAHNRNLLRKLRRLNLSFDGKKFNLLE